MKMVYLWIVVAGLAIIWALIDALTLKSELHGRQKSDQLFEKLQPKFTSSVEANPPGVDPPPRELQPLG